MLARRIEFVVLIMAYIRIKKTRATLQEQGRGKLGLGLVHGFHYQKLSCHEEKLNENVSLIPVSKSRRANSVILSFENKLYL